MNTSRLGADVVRTLPTSVLTVLHLMRSLPARPRLCRDSASRGGTYWKLRYVIPGAGLTAPRRKSIYLGRLDKWQVSVIERTIERIWLASNNERRDEYGIEERAQR